jgi:hypothetical protein
MMGPAFTLRDPVIPPEFRSRFELSTSGIQIYVVQQFIKYNIREDSWKVGEIMYYLAIISSVMHIVQ